MFDPAGDLSVDDLDAAQVFASGRTSVPGGGFDAIAGRESVDIDLSGSRDLTGESGARGGESECQLAGGVLRLVDEGNVKGEEGVDVVVGGGGRDQAGVLSAESNVGLSLLDRDNQVGEEGGICAWGRGGLRGSGGGDTFVDRDRGRVVGRRRRVDGDGDGAGGMGRGRRRRSGRGRGASGGARSGNADVVFADSRVGVTSFAVLVGHAAQRRRLRRLGCGRGAWSGGGFGGGDRLGVR